MVSSIHVPIEIKMTLLKKTNTEQNFKITVDYGYDLHSIIVSSNQIDNIRNAESLTIQGQGFYIEGDMERDYWFFHRARPNSLEVETEGGHQVFDGDLIEVIISDL